MASGPRCTRTVQRGLSSCQYQGSVKISFPDVHSRRHLLRADTNPGPGGDYRITSLYFDDAFDSALFEKTAGVQHRQKVRVRIYDGSPEVIMLEQKIKHGEGVRKERLRIDRRCTMPCAPGFPNPCWMRGTLCFRMQPGR